jgi:MFS family permease
MAKQSVQASLERNIKVFTAHAILKGIYIHIHQVIYQPFMLSLNPSMTLLGLLEGLGGYQGLLGAFVRPFFGWLSDRVRRKPFIILGSLLTAISISCFLISGITNIYWFIVPAIILLGISYIDIPIVDSLIAESVEPAKRGSAYSRISLAWMTPGIFSPFIGGLAADVFGFPVVFGVGIGIECVVLCILIRYLRENPRPRRVISLSEFASFMKRNLAPPPSLRNIYLLNMFDAVVYGLGPMLKIGIFRAHFHFSNFQLGVITIFGSVVMILTQIFIARAIQKYGCKTVLLVSYITWAVHLGGIAISKNFTSVLLLQIFMGVAIAAFMTPHQTLMANSTEPLERAEAVGRISLYRGMLGFVAPYLGGFLYEQYGYSAPLLASFMGGMVVTVFIHFYIRVENDRLI